MAQRTVKEPTHPLFFKILHELIMISIVVLVLTGYYIHGPFIGGAGFLMSMARGVHFFFAAVLIIATIIRVLAMFIGKRRDWNSFIPTWSDIKLLPRVINYYAYIGKEVQLVKKYNPLQMFSYCLAFLLIIFQILSGLALMWPDGAFSWWNYGLFNNEIASRMAHFIVTWMFIMFIMIHVYLSIRETFSEIKPMHLLSEEETEES